MNSSSTEGEQMLKRLVLYTFLLVLLSACGNREAEETNTIAAADLSEREKTLLHATAGNMLFIYNLSLQSQGVLDVWVEKYEYGKLQEERIGHVAAAVNKKGQILVALIEVPQSKQMVVRVTIINEAGYESGEGTITLPDIGAFGYGTLASDEGTSLKKDMAIGQLIYAGESNFFKTSQENLGNNATEIIKTLKDRPEVYLIRSSFTKEATAPHD